MCAPSGDQWTQFDSRDISLHEAALQKARAFTTRHRYHQIFINPASATLFQGAAKRYFETLRADTSLTSHQGRLWLVQTTADPTFGALRGAPFPARAVLIEGLSNSTSDDTQEEVDTYGASRWLRALDRVGKGLSPMESHYVDYAICASYSCMEHTKSLPSQAFVASEILNADWTDCSSIDMMRDILMRHAEHSVTHGMAKRFEVLQSIDEATCFKTMEVYDCMHDLQVHMNEDDVCFARDVSSCRAAVNRVRQLYRPFDSL